MSRSRPKRRRQPQNGNLGFRAYEQRAMAETVVGTYVQRCRELYRPDDFFILTQTEGGAAKHYPVLVIRDPEVRRLHTRHSGFKVVPTPSL